MNDEQFRPQAPSRPRYKLQEDSMAGLKQTTDNNQPLMALQYAYKAIGDLVQRVEMLEQDIVDLLERAARTDKAVTKPARTKAEEVTAEV